MKKILLPAIALILAVLCIACTNTKKKNYSQQSSPTPSASAPVASDSGSSEDNHSANDKSTIKKPDLVPSETPSASNTPSESPALIS